MTEMENSQKTKETLEQLFKEALNTLKRTKKLEGTDRAFTPLVKGLLEASMEGEMDTHLTTSRPNRRNGKGKKQVKTSFGDVRIETPRDRCYERWTSSEVPKNSSLYKQTYVRWKRVLRI